MLPIAAKPAAMLRTVALLLVALLGTLLVSTARAKPAETPADPEPPPATAGPPGAGELPPEPAGDGEPPDEGTPPPSVEPPRLLQSPAPAYPSAHRGHTEHPAVVVTVTLDSHGDLVEATVEQPGHPDFDAAAMEAVRRWRFAPALRDGRPVAARTRVAVHFQPPAPAPAPEPAPEPETTSVPAPASEPALEPSDSYGASGRGQRDPLRSRDRGPADTVIDRGFLEAAPTQEGAELLRRAPGVYVGRAEGDAVAHNIILRGFDADHGQDMELRVGGLPLNQPSHIHGQGYADLNLLIGEAVNEMRVTEGVYDTRQGDFAVAGSIDFELGVDRSQHDEALVRLTSSYGSFGTFRQSALWAPAGQSAGTVAALQYRQSDGFGEQRGSRSVSGTAQWVHDAGRLRFRTLSLMHGARADTAGVLRKDDIEAGQVGYYDAYPFPTAQQQNAANTRFMLGGFLEYRGDDGETADLGVWLGRDDFRAQQNFTGFLQRSRVLEDVAGRGDLFEQTNFTRSLGASARYRTASARPFDGLVGQLELAVDSRFDDIEQTQNLLDASVGLQTWDQRVDAGIGAMDIGLRGEIDTRLADIVSLRAGIRADVLSYNVDDRLANFAPASRPEDAFIQGYRRSAMGVAWGPRLSATVDTTPWLAVLGAYGEGFRSPQARVLEDGDASPFTKVRSADLGVRLHDGKLGQATLLGYWTHLSDDVAFEPREARLERLGESRRMGVSARGQSRWRMLTGMFSVTYVHASLLEPPPATADNPDPPFEKGQSLPYVPPVVLRLDLRAKHELMRLGRSRSLTGDIGSGYSYLSARPLPYGEQADPVSLLDVTAGLTLAPFTLRAEVYNLIDAEYAAVEYNYVSHWNPAEPPSRLPARHLSAGAPRTVMFTLEVAL